MTNESGPYHQNIVKWYWNSYLQCLEDFNSVNANVQKSKTKEKKRSKAMPNQLIYATSEHTVVTIQDIKTVTRERMLEVNYISEPFLSIMNSAEFDDFLMKLINYFHWFFEKRTIDLNLDADTKHIEQSLQEIDEYQDICKKQYLSERSLAYSYALILLGNAGIEEHHMKCGKNLVSNSERDKDLFETLFSYSAIFVWITFGRREYSVVQIEINRLFRSNFFNPSLHKIESTNRKSKSNVPIFSILKKSSPIILSILPTAKELSTLYDKSDYSKKCNLMIPRSKCVRFDQSQLKDINYILPRVGILGEPLHLFSLFTLAPLEETTENIQNAKPKVMLISSDDSTSEHQTN